VFPLHPMRRRFALIAFVALALATARAATPDVAAPTSGTVDYTHLPWQDGEALTYLVSWTGFNAAEGVFVAKKKSDHWEYRLNLHSMGLVDDIYPFTGYFWSVCAPAPLWRSIEYGEFRFEPRRDIKEQTQIDYTKQKGTRSIWTNGESKTFPIAEDSVDDVGTMLYHIRAETWKPGDHRTLHVYESDSEKEALVECQGRETRAFGTWPSQPLLRLQALPGKGTHHRGGLMLWMTDDDRRLPVHAELNFRYGSFSIDLTKVAKGSP
jgi:hypothetical protein